MVLFLFVGAGECLGKEGSVLFPPSTWLRWRKEVFVQVLGELAFFFFLNQVAE